MSQTVNGCESTRTAVSVTVNQTPSRAQGQCAEFLQCGEPDGCEPGGQREQPGNVYNVAVGGGALSSHGVKQRDLLREP